MGMQITYEEADEKVREALEADEIAVGIRLIEPGREEYIRLVSTYAVALAKHILAGGVTPGIADQAAWTEAVDANPTDPPAWTHEPVRNFIARHVEMFDGSDEIND